MKRFYSIITLYLLFLTAGRLAAQVSVTVSGRITDAGTGETLIGAGAVCGKTGAVTNNFGFYTLTLPTGEAVLTYTYVGYETETVRLQLQRDTTLDISLRPGATLSEAVVTAQKEAGIQSTKMSAIEVPVHAIKQVPVLFGEADVLKTLQLLPGVQGGAEGFSGLYVRGGGPDENLLLLDGIPVYNAEHLLGLFSIFQPEAVKKVTLYKGSFPARYGGRVSSIIDVRTNDGNLYETHGTFGISAISDKLHIEGPLWKGRTSYSLSGRGMHTVFVVPLLRPMLEKMTGEKLPANYYFYDVNAKVTHRFGNGDRLYFNLYNGRDTFYYKDKEDSRSNASLSQVNDKIDLGWGNTVAALRWNHAFTGKLFANTTLAYNAYRMSVGTDIREESHFNDQTSSFIARFDYRSGIRDWNAKIDFDYSPNPNHLVRFGGEYLRHTFIPQNLSAMSRETENGEVVVDTTFHFQSADEARILGHEAALYLEDDFTLGQHLTLNPGVHLSLFHTQGKTYGSIQPRLAAKWAFPADWSVKASWSRMAQYVHLLSSSMISLPVDLWVPITKNIRPEISDQYSLGVYYSGLRGWEFSLEGYWKDIRNVLEYKDGVSFMFNTHGWEEKVEMGNGRAMGIEFYAEKTMGRTTGWLGYTLAKSDRIFPDGSINGGRRFPYRYDRRHKLNLVLNHKLNEKWDFNASWNLASGGTTTIPERETAVLMPNGTLHQVEYVSSRNNFRLPATHHLDIGLNRHKKKKHGESIWNFSIYNVYMQKNPNFVIRSSDWEYEDTSGSYQSTVKMKKITVLPFLPSIGYTYNF